MIRLAVTPRSFRAVPGRHQDRLREAGAEVRYPVVDRLLNEDEMVELVAGCDGLIVGLDPVSSRVLDAGPLRVVVKYGSGLDNVDLPAAAARGVPVLTTPGANSQAVAELTVGLLFALARRIVDHHVSAASGEWQRHIGLELRGRRLGLIGYGQVGRRVAALAEGIGMKVVASDPYVGEADVPLVPLGELVGSVDAVSLHLPLTQETRHLVDAAFLAKMRRGAWLVNTARGGLADLDAVVDALQTGQLGGAAFDDFEIRPEPDSPIWQLPNFIASPHAGASTVEAAERTGLAAVEAALRALGGADDNRRSRTEAAQRRRRG
jgi:phosphoglycerate dehydrogenase-like enzyme